MTNSFSETMKTIRNGKRPEGRLAKFPLPKRRTTDDIQDTDNFAERCKKATAEYNFKKQLAAMRAAKSTNNI